jgi:hypothetical protein
MEEFESQTDNVEEHLHEHAHHATEKWISGVALTAALLAAMAASAAMLSGHFVDDAMLEQMKASDGWNYFGVKGIKSSILESRINEHEMQGQPVNPKDRAKLAGYETEKVKIQDEAKRHEENSKVSYERHETLAKGVTLFQVAIAVSAIAALTRRKRFWFVGMALGAAGIVFFVLGFLPTPPAP